MIITARTAGRLCLVGSGLGVLQGLGLLLVPAAVGPEQYSYPLTPSGHVVAQVSFAVQHLLLLAGLVALARCQARSRLSRSGLWGGVVGLTALTVMELVTISAAHVTADSPRAALINSLYGVPTLIMGASLVVGGIGFARAGRLPGEIDPVGWRRWVPLVIGAYVFVPLLPAIMAPFLFGRLAIMGWMITFAALGWMLVRPQPTQESLDKISSRTLAASA